MDIKVKLAAIAKDEGAYIPQWIHHHLFFGFDKIEIWINGTTDNSIEILESIKSNYPPEIISYINADQLLKTCKAENKSFQVEAYSKIYNQTLLSSDCTHLMFLDLDELWTPKDFKTSIKKVILNNLEADVISFQWFLDSPNIDRQTFQPPFENKNVLQKNRHVKSLIKVTSRVKKLDMHNHVIDNGVYRLCNGDPFIETDKEQHNKAKISLALFNETKSIIDDYFIYHQINRSRVEYLSSLLRGRSHVNDQSIFKVNRVGYIPDRNSNPGISFAIDTTSLTTYEDSYRKFVAKQSLLNLIKEAQDFVQKRFLQAIQYLQTNPALIQEYQIPLRGVKINDLANPPINKDNIIYSIDKINLTTDKSSIIITGWAFDFLSSIPPRAAVIFSSGREILLPFHTIKRPDVIKAHPEAHLDSGFQIEIKISDLSLMQESGSPQYFDIFFKTSTHLQKIKFSEENSLEKIINNYLIKS